MIGGVNHLTFAVRNLERSFRFYVEILGCKPIVRWPTGAYLIAGETWVALEQTLEAPLPENLYTHIAFSVGKTQFEGLVERIKASGAREWSDNRSEGASFYFCDPDGYQLEIHVGDLASRIQSMKDKPWSQFEFFEL